MSTTGYTTDFEGSIAIEPPLNKHEIEYLTQFANTRRMERTNGPYFVKGEGAFGQGAGPDTIVDHNGSGQQPGLWCQWEPSSDGTDLHWDGGEKFYNSAEWMKFLIEHFLQPDAFVKHGLFENVKIDPRLAHFTFDHVLNGTIDAQGEDSDDKWRLIVEDNVVKVAEAQITYAEPHEL